MVVEAMKHTAMEVLLLGNTTRSEPKAPRHRCAGRVRESREGMDEFPTEILGGAVEFCAGAANLESFESSGFRWDVFNRSPSISELSESFQFVEMFENHRFPIQPDAVQQKLFFWHGVLFFGFVLLLHDIARQQAS